MKMNKIAIENNSIKKVILSVNPIIYISDIIIEILSKEELLETNNENLIEFAKTFVENVNEYVSVVLTAALNEVVKEDLGDKDVIYDVIKPIVKLTYKDDSIILKETNEALSVYTFAAIQKVLDPALIYSMIVSIYDKACNENIKQDTIDKIVKSKDKTILLEELKEKIEELAKMNPKAKEYFEASLELVSLYNNLAVMPVMDLVAEVMNKDKSELSYEDIKFSVVRDPELEIILQ